MNTLKIEPTLRAEAWSLVAYKKVNVSLKNLKCLLKVFGKILINCFATHKQHPIKVIDSSSFRNKLYSTFVVDSMMSDLVHISDRHLRSPLRIHKLLMEIFYWLSFHKTLHHQTTINPHQKSKALRIKTWYTVQ